VAVAKTPAPLLGFNNNVRHRGRIFHIQTEDSGVKSPRIVTHLFADGGRIVKTTRTDYSEHVGQKDMAPVVRKLMKEQHKAMFIALRAGELDQLLEQVCGPLPLETRSVPPAIERIAEAPSPSQVHASPAPLPGPAVHTTPAQGSLAVAVAVAVESADPAGAPQPLTLQNPALRRVVAAVPPPPPLEAAFDLAVGALTATGNAVPPGTEPRPKRTPPPIPRPTPAAGTAPGAAASAVPPSTPPGRYAAPRPAAIFNQSPADKQSIFGESVISEQSLDEVILSYLAEDLEERPQK
jgi:hypothetical protein